MILKAFSVLLSLAGYWFLDRNDFTRYFPYFHKTWKFQIRMFSLLHHPFYSPFRLNGHGPILTLWKLCASAVLHLILGETFFIKRVHVICRILQSSVIHKAMKSSYLLGPFWYLKFLIFSLLQIKTDWVLWFK